MGAIYMECSAKEQRGVAEVFELAINTAIQTEEESYERSGSSGNSVQVKGRRKTKKRTCKIL
jgi:Ras family protein A